MTNKMPDQKPKKNLAAGLLTFLRDHQEDRGMMANLRWGIIKAKQRRTWPILARFNGIGKSHHAQVTRTIAALFAVHPKETERVNFGATCYRLMDKDEQKEFHQNGKTGPLTKRFLHLLSAEGDEIFERVIRLTLRAKTCEDGIPVNYEKLFWDLWNWEKEADRIRESWARSFWKTQTKVDRT